MKKIFAILMSLALMLSLAVPAMAADITITNTVDGYKYVAYQVFKGDVSKNADNKDVLSNITWGDDVNVATLITNLKSTFTGESYGAIQALTGESSAAAVAEAIKGVDGAQLAKCIVTALNGDGNELAYNTNAKEYSVTDLAAGYYLVKNTEVPENAENTVYSTYILEVLASEKIAPKSEKPTVDKQVWDEEGDDDDKEDENWGETADHEINETFQFKLIATLPADPDFGAYETYKVVFNDTMSAGITFVSLDSVKINETIVVNEKAENNPNGYVKSDIVDNAWTLTIDDITKYDTNLADGAVIEVIYSAKLNENAKIADGNEDDDDNKNTVYLQYSNNPNVSGEGVPEELGKTKEDTVWVFTYEMNGTKVDGADEKTPLPGAEFVLYRKVTRNNAEVTEYVTLDDNNKVTGWTTTKPETGNIKTVANGIIKITGLDHGTYYLEETKAPAGYNKLETPYTVEITAEHNEAADTNSATTSITYKVNNVEATAIKVINNAGTVLPETGGMGTTIFYVVGGVMVAAAAILLITKKRMSAEG